MAYRETSHPKGKEESSNTTPLSRVILLQSESTSSDHDKPPPKAGEHALHRGQSQKARVLVPMHIKWRQRVNAEHRLYQDPRWTHVDTGKHELQER